jgi:hypothetical protein
MRVRERLEPVRQREGRIGLLCLAEGVGRPAVFEAVQQGDAALEGGLRGGSPRVLEVDDAEVMRHAVPVVVLHAVLRDERREGNSQCDDDAGGSDARANAGHGRTRSIQGECGRHRTIRHGRRPAQVWGAAAA